jgi:hypothetical protein
LASALRKVTSNEHLIERSCPLEVQDHLVQRDKVTVRIRNESDPHGLCVFSPWHPTDDVGGDQRAAGWIPQQDDVSLSQSQKDCHRGWAWGKDMMLIVFGDDQDLEPAVLTVLTGDPVGVEHLDASCSLACAWHRIKYRAFEASCNS